MSLTLDQIRAAVGAIADSGFRSGISTSGSTTTLVDAVGLVRPLGDTRYEGGYVLRTSKTTSDRLRGVSTDTSTTGTLTVSPAYSVTVGTEAYEVWSDFDPVGQVEAAVNRAMRRMVFVEEIDLTGVSQQRQYSLASYPWLTRANQFVELLWRYGSTVGAYLWLPVVGARITTDEDALVLDLGQQVFSSSDTLRLRALRTYASLGTLTLGADTVTVPADYLDWFAWETYWELLQTPAALRTGTENQALQDREEHRVKMRLLALRNKYRPKISQSLVGAPERPWGAYAGWPGRW